MIMIRKSRTARKLTRPRPRPATWTARPASWPAWTDAERWYPVLDGLDDAIAEDAEQATGPSRIDAAYYSGFTLGVDGQDDAMPPAEFDELEQHMFRCGRRAGWQDSTEGRAWRDSVLEADAARDPSATWPEAEFRFLTGGARS